MQQERFEVFATLIGGIHGNIQKIKSRYSESLGLKAVHVFWLYLLKTHPEGLSASELAAAGGTNRSLVSREIDTMLEQGLIDILEKGENRRYGWKLVLTEKGSQLAGRISRIAKGVQDEVNRDIPQEDLLVFYKTLRLLSLRFEEVLNSNSLGEIIDEC